MSKKLCIAEKPSVGRDIARIVHADEKHDGYMEGKDYVVTWAFGHLVGLAEPERYGFVPHADLYQEDKEEKKLAREKAYDELPLMPDDFKLEVLEQGKKQFYIIRDLIHRDDIDWVINCGDMGPEGHVLQWMIREKAECDKPVARFCATSMTDEAIRKAFNNLRHEEEFTNIVKGEFAKKKADWMLGMSLSRAVSIKYNKHLTVGRVQSPTLYFVVERYIKNKTFKETKYYALEADIGDINVLWDRDTEAVFSPSLKDDTGRLLDKGAAQNKVDAIKGTTGVVTKVSKETKKQNPPQLYDITELEREANRQYGYSAIVTLSTAQALYETQKVITYPRTDSRYITTDLFPYMEDRIEAIGKLNTAYQEAVDILDTVEPEKYIVDDSKVSDHHAIIPTEKIDGFNMNAMRPLQGEKENGVTEETLYNILDLILRRTVETFGRPYVYEQTKIDVKFNDITFCASHKKILDNGFKDMFTTEDIGEQKDLDLTEGQEVEVLDCTVVEKKTTPPPLYTEATLLTAMEQAGNKIENGKVIAEKGIGTQATRAGIIRDLFTRGYVKNKGKSIIPTSVGINLIKVLPEDLYSPKITADWEEQIKKIADGEENPERFLEDFKSFLLWKTKEVKDADTGVSFYKKQEDVLRCPWCSGELRRWEDKKYVSYYCKTENCGFCMRTDNKYINGWLKRDIKESELAEFIKNKTITLTQKKEKGKKAPKIIFDIVGKYENNGKIYVSVRATPTK